MLVKFTGTKRQLCKIDQEELLYCLSKFYSIDELKDIPCTTQNFIEFLECEFGIVDYICRDNSFLRNTLSNLSDKGLLNKITETGNGNFVRRFIWSPIKIKDD